MATSNTFRKNLVQFYDSEFPVTDLLAEQRYINAELIDEGSSKEVYQVTDTHCAREVAYAKIKKGLFNLENAIDFVREVQVTSGFEHPNIIRIYDVGITDGRPWFTMEINSGKTLRDLIAAQPNLSLAERLEIFVQLCDAVDYAHQRDVLHLDLKPDNVSIGKRGQVLLADWGLAASANQQAEADLVNAQSPVAMIKGSLGYMAPEQTDPATSDVPSADIFGLGGILHFLLTKEPPMFGEGRDVLLQNTKAGHTRNLDRPEIPPRLVPLLRKVLAKSPTDRYPSAAALKAEIEAFRNGFITLAETASPWTKVSLFCKRNKALTATLLIAVTTLLGSTLYYIQSIKKSEASALAARVEAEQQRERAIEQKTRAEESLQNLLAAQEETRLTNVAFSSNLYEDVAGMMAAFKFDEALLFAEEAVKRNPQNPEALHRLGVIQFIRQDFAEAAPYFKKSRLPFAKEFLKLANTYQHRPRPLATPDLLELLSDLDHNAFVQQGLFRFDSRLRPPHEHAQAVRWMLQHRNQLDTLHFKYFYKNRTLNLSGNPDLKTISSPKTHFSPAVNLLGTLPIKRLILDDTPQNRANIAQIMPHPKCVVSYRKLPH